MEHQHHPKLTVRVESFSYRKGYPADESGNGGGFVFDCRCLHNPGRYDEYKPLTGRDAEVIEFLEKRGEVRQFLVSAKELTTMAISKYVSRGFTDLFIGFGCTGGRHRSVYCAEQMAHFIKTRFPEVKVLLCHKEQQIKEEL